MIDFVIRIPYKLPSLNDYANACRSNKFVAAKMKKEVQNDIAVFMKKLPKFDNPVKIHFHWIEGTKRRDFDNICFAKKFILDTLVDLGKLRDDNRKYVQAFRDSFSYGSSTEVVLKISEIKPDDVKLPDFVKKLFNKGV